jgi:hypothetical protein
MFIYSTKLTSVCDIKVGDSVNSHIDNSHKICIRCRVSLGLHMNELIEV